MQFFTEERSALSLKSAVFLRQEQQKLNSIINIYKNISPILKKRKEKKPSVHDFLEVKGKNRI